jgi:hypothetical protein
MCIVVEEFWCNDVHFAILLSIHPFTKQYMYVLE